MKKKKFNVVHKDMMVNVIILDLRCIPVTCHLRCAMQIPEFLLKEGQVITWSVDGIKERCKGRICDANANSVSIVFPFAEDRDALPCVGKITPLSFEEIIDLFKAWEPRLLEVGRALR